jgi:hypothetical protein
MFSRIGSPGRLLAAAACAVFLVGAAPASAADPPPPGVVYANLASRTVEMRGWPLGSTLLATLNSTATFTGAVTPEGNVGPRPYPADSGELFWQGVTLTPGDQLAVVVIDGPGLGLHREMVVGPIAIEEIDYANDLVYGVAYKSIIGDLTYGGGLVQICAGWNEVPGADYSCRWVQTDDLADNADYGSDTSTWMADFSAPGADPGGRTWPAFDLAPYWQGVQVSQEAIPRLEGTYANQTLNDPAAYPYLDVQYNLHWDPPASGKAVAYAFDVGTTVDFTLTKEDTVSCAQPDVMVSPAGTDSDGWEHQLAYANLDLGQGEWPACNPQSGDVLIVQGTSLGQPLEKALVITPPMTDGGSLGADVDVDYDMVNGFVPAGYDVEVAPWDGGGSVHALVPEGDTQFFADMNQIGYDVQPWSWFGVEVFEPDGDRVDTQLRASETLFEVFPDQDLTDGQVVTVRGSNFTPGVGSLVQGHGFIGGLDEATREPLLIGLDGSFETTFAIHRMVNVPTGPEQQEFVDVDCAGVAAPDSCFIAVMDESGSDYAQAWLEVRVPTVALSLNPTGTLSKVGGRVSVGGSLWCDPLDTAVVTGSLWQRVGRKSVATGTFTLVAPCTQSTWSAVVSPGGQVPFVPGKAELTASATLTVSPVVRDDATAVISIKAPPKR